MDKKQVISFDDFKRVIDYFMSEGGIEELSLSGGEPFLHPDLFKMVEYAKSFQIRTVLFTSGVKKSIPFDEKTIKIVLNEMAKTLEEIEQNEPWNERLKNNIRRFYERMIHPPIFGPITKEDLQRLKEIGLDKIVFDYQAYECETDQYLMGRDGHKHYCLLDSLMKASVVGLETDVHFIPMKPNYKEIVDILEMLEIAKINHISILHFVPQGRGFKNKSELVLDDSELLEFMSLLANGQGLYSGNIRIGIPLMADSMHKCNAGLEKLDIKFDGTILPCPAFKELDADTMKKYGIKIYSIYEALHEVKTPGGKRREPLCRKVYKK